MARQQYIVNSDGQWTSNYGYSFLALANLSGSGLRLVLRQLSVFVQTQKGAAAPACNARLYQAATPFVGEDMRTSAVKLDSSASFPATTVVRRNVQIASFAASAWPVSLIRHSGAVGTQETIYCSANIGADKFAASYRSGSKRGTTAVEPITVPQNMGLALVCGNNTTETQPVRVNVVASIDGKTVVWDFVAVPKPGLGIFSIENTGTNVVKLLRYSFAELGTTDTPFIRVVPIGQMYASDILDSSKQGFTVQKLNSADPDLTALKVFGDLGFIPSGSPEVVINEGSGGSPKGVNYLHTRDFNGPAYRVFLPEMRAGAGPGVGNDMLGHHNAHRASDLLTRVRGSIREPISLNPGEGVALVASSETFIGVQGAYSGWPALSFQAIIESQSLASLSFSGIVSGSRLYVELASGGPGVAGTVVYNGVVTDDPVVIPYTYAGNQPFTYRVRKASGAPYYRALQGTGTITSAGFSADVQQISDE